MCRRTWRAGHPGESAHVHHMLGSILAIIQVTMGTGLPSSGSHSIISFTQSHNQEEDEEGGCSEMGGVLKGGDGAYVMEAGARRYMKCVNMCVK